MKEQDQQIALCEWVGWKRHCVEATWWLNPEGKLCLQHDMPKFNSLDVLHEMEKRLTPEQSSQMVCEISLMHVGTGSFYTFNSALLHASAAQRREALLKTLNLWKE